VVVWPAVADDGVWRLSRALHLRALRQLPVRPWEMAGVTVRIPLEIVLMLRLGFPENAGRRHLGHDFARPKPGGIHVGYRVFPDALLLIIHAEDCGTIAGADVVALAIERRRIMDLEEKFQKVAIADPGRVEYNLDSLGVVAMIAIGGIGHITTGVAHAR
jgi:hypothetical protein